MQMISSMNYIQKIIMKQQVENFFIIGLLVKSSLEQSGHAIHFGKMALQIFMNQHNFYRILHTLMLLGINYTHSNIYEEAQECFNHLIRNAELLKEEKLLPQIYHNMGYLQNKMKNAKEALLLRKKFSFAASEKSKLSCNLYTQLVKYNYKLVRLWRKQKEYFQFRLKNFPKRLA